MTSGFSLFSSIIEQHISKSEYCHANLEEVARIKADIILTDFHKSLRRSYYPKKLAESFLASLCDLKGNEISKGFEMAINGFDTGYGSIIFIEIMKELNILGISDIDLDAILSLNIAVNGSNKADKIAQGYGICIAVYDIKEYLKELQIIIDDPKIILPSTAPLKEEINSNERRVLQSKDEENNSDKLSHKQQILFLEKLGFFDLPTLKNLTTINKGKLLSYLLNRSEKNSTDYIRNLDVPKGRVKKDANFVKTEKNIQHVNTVMQTLRLQQQEEFVVTTEPTTPKE